ncbi:MAG: glycosyltransferase [Methanobrevibacter sp.]|nr:glycosyltransferase [Methanobrevibacter sp.]
MHFILVILLFLLSSISSSNSKEEQSVSVVIPAYNEERTVSNVVNVVKELSYVDEVIVVDDGSIDNTVEEAKNSGATVISHTKNQGKGSAINTGFRHSKGDIVAFIDADIYNFDYDKIDSIIRPILEGKTDITKTKFIRESGRVTELTAKPLLKFFFPEITFDQPLSGQFAGKRSVLSKIKFEKDYGVDVGIVLDADAHGIQIEEVDIGEIKHEMSPLMGLNEMANEVVRTIINKSIEYGRVTMMDSMGNYIRMATLGLSLIILGLFTLFFVQGIPLEIGIAIGIIGLIIAIYHLFKLIIKSINIFRNKPKANLLKPFFKMHFSVIISAFVLILMISTFLSAANFSDGKISIEPTSRTLVIFPDSPEQPIYVRGPYKVDSALENEVNIIRIPEDALKTLELSYGDKLIINGQYYTVNKTRDWETNVLRLPEDVRKSFSVQVGDTISDGRIRGIFEGIEVDHPINSTNLSNIASTNEYFIINSRLTSGYVFEIYLDNKLIDNLTCAVKNGSEYSISANGYNIKSILMEDIRVNNSYFTYYGDHIIEIKVVDKVSSSKYLFPNSLGSFLSFNFNPIY